METGEITIKTITAAEGKWLTQNVDSMDNRTFARTIYLGVSDTEANYKEVDDDYKASGNDWSWGDVLADAVGAVAGCAVGCLILIN